MKYKWCTVTQELHTPGFSDHNIQCYSNSWLPGQHSQTTPNRCLPLWAGTPTFWCTWFALPWQIDGWRRDPGINWNQPSLRVNGTTMFQLVHFRISRDRDFKSRHTYAFSSKSIYHYVTGVLHFFCNNTIISISVSVLWRRIYIWEIKSDSSMVTILT